jgi:hypothetical protein
VVNKRKMKKNNIIYWSATGIFSTFIFFTGIAYFIDPQFIEIFEHLGFPDYFRIEIGIAKILGVIALTIPSISVRVKEFTYIGFSIMLISGGIAHYNSGDSAGKIINALVFFTLLVISYIFWNRRRVKLPSRNS